MSGKNILSLLGLLVAAVSLASLLVQHHLFAHAPILIAGQVAAAGLMLWGRLTFGARSFHAAASTSQGPLVTHGPYRYWRHPIYASIIYFTWLGQVEAPALLPVALAALVSAGLIARMLIEEHFLLQAYPDYRAYMQSAKRLIPFVF